MIDFGHVALATPWVVSAGLFGWLWWRKGRGKHRAEGDLAEGDGRSPWQLAKEAAERAAAENRAKTGRALSLTIADVRRVVERDARVAEVVKSLDDRRRADIPMWGRDNVSADDLIAELAEIYRAEVPK